MSSFGKMLMVGLIGKIVGINKNFAGCVGRAVIVHGREYHISFILTHNSTFFESLSGSRFRRVVG